VKRRFVYPLLFALPALLASGIVALFASGAAAGALWLFVLGDDRWPASAGHVVVGTFVAAFAGTLAALLAAAYALGRRQEATGKIDRRHLLAAAGATALLVLVVAAHQWRVGNLGPKSDGVLCSEHCLALGFAGSGTPPRDSGAATCSCYDAQGREATKVPLADLAARRRGGR